jgi:hypothetical protein
VDSLLNSTRTLKRTNPNASETIPKNTKIGNATKLILQYYPNVKPGKDASKNHKVIDQFL